jgi:hypothetical protein
MEDEQLLTAAERSLRNPNGGLTRSHVVRYDFLRQQLVAGNVTVNADFRRRFAGLYRIRSRTVDWKDGYFSLMEREKGKVGHDIGALLDEFRQATGRVELSFISKLIAIIDPAQPVWDSVVTGHLKIPNRYPWTLDERVTSYQTLKQRTGELLAHPLFAGVHEAYDCRFPGHGHMPMRILDASLWALRP